MDVFAPEILETLQKGKITIQGEFLWGSNYTFLARVEHAGNKVQAVYKPTRGERPLWDFPVSTLAKREAAAFVVSEGLGWRIVPPTMYRSRGPVGAGSLQIFIQHDSEYHYFNFKEEDRQRLRPVVLFDLLINNADRKGSHVLIDEDNHLWLIDHGICFHVEDKLRTVIWDFVGEEIPADLCAQIADFSARLSPVDGSPSPLTTSLLPLLSQEEIFAMKARAEYLITMGKFPPPNPYRRPYPWPQI